jgi:hypothetical protein
MFVHVDQIVSFFNFNFRALHIFAPMYRTEVVPVGGNGKYNSWDAYCPVTTTLTYNKKCN